MERTENKMLTMPVNRLLVTMSLPIIVSMIIQALYNVVDSIFVSQISENALTAVSLVFPVQNIMIGVATGLAVGVNALLSRSLGEKNTERANMIGRNGLFLALIAYLVFLVFGLFCTEWFISVQTDDREIIGYGCRYLSVCTVFSFGVFGEIMFERLMQATGKTIYTMFTHGIGAIINIILDPIMIFGLLGFPKLGVTGAAAATVTGQIIAFIVAVIFNRKYNTEINVGMKGFRPSGRAIKNILSIGTPSILLVGIGSVMSYLMNMILLGFTSTAAAVFGVYFKLQSFIFMPVFGLNNGTIPIIAFNYGAVQRKRMMKTLRLSAIYSMGIMAVGTILFTLFPETLLGFFKASDTMLRIGVPALRTISVGFVLAGYCIIINGLFQAMGHGLFAMFVSAARQLVVLIPLAYLMSRTGSIDLVWWSFPIAELSAVILCTVFFIRLYKKTIRHLH